jgi:hypothetical protein
MSSRRRDSYRNVVREILQAFLCGSNLTCGRMLTICFIHPEQEAADVVSSSRVSRV